MPVQNITLERTRIQSKAIQYADAGDIVTLDKKYSMAVFLRHGLNAGTFQSIPSGDDILTTYVGPGNRFIAVASGNTSFLYRGSHGRPVEEAYPILFLPLKEEAIIDVHGPLVLIYQVGTRWTHAAGQVGGHDYSKIVTDQRPDFLEQLKAGQESSPYVPSIRRFLEGVDSFARDKKESAHAKIEEEVLPLLTLHLRQAAAELVEKGQMTKDVERHFPMLENGMMRDMEAAELKTPILPRAIAAAPNEHLRFDRR